MAKTVRFSAEGGPEVLELVDAEIGEPGPGELRMRVEAIGLNRAEAMFRSGTYFERPNEFPARLGYTASGVVEAVGPDVRFVEPGDHVVLCGVKIPQDRVLDSLRLLCQEVKPQFH